MKNAIKHETIIKPARGWFALDFRELWDFRGLLYTFAWRDIKVKYKQTALGVMWILLQPIMSMVIFSLLFGRIAKFPSDGQPYPIFVFAGLIPWTYFSNSFTLSTTSIVNNSNLIKKTYFPRIFIPLGVNIAVLADFGISCLAMAAMMVIYGVPFTVNILLIPVSVLMLVLASLGPSLLCGALNVRYRDVGHTLPFIVQIWMFVTPVIYPLNFIPERYRMLAYLNPLSGPVEAFRASVLGTGTINMSGIAISFGMSLALFAIGLYYYRRVERTFADIM
jgi:lipopolysaccharide transport system permease protein